MTDKELEQRLAQALSNAAPDDLDGVLSRCETRKGIVIPMKKKTTGKMWKTMIAACLALVLVGGGGAYYYQANAVASVVSLDVNPCVELKVNSKEKVLSATPMNEDGKKLLEGLELKGTQADVAMYAIIGALLEQGYVDELANSILITVEDNDTQRGEKLQAELTAQADAALASAQVNGAILSQTLSNDDGLRQKAEEYGISSGKAALIAAIVEGSNNTKTFESRVGLSINELNLLYSAQSAAPSKTEESGVIGGADGPTAILTTDGISATGSASQNAYIGPDAAKQAALKHAGLSSGDVTFLKAEYDYDDGRMVYEVEFRADGAKYEYEIDALSGDVVKYENEKNTAASGSSGTTASGSYIGEAAAKAAALKHAGVKESDTQYCNAWLEYDDGRPECYEVEFMAGFTRYEYEIALTSETVLSFESKSMASKPAGQTGSTSSGTGSSGSAGTSASGSAGGGTSSDIGSEAAKSAALSHAGVSASQVFGLKAERDYDDGRLEYEVEFRAGGMEYEYKIDGTTGKILEYDQERDD